MEKPSGHSVFNLVLDEFYSILYASLWKSNPVITDYTAAVIKG